jgi:hypothetical protein
MMIINSYSFQPAGSPPAAPSGLAISSGGGELINYSFTDNASDETGFRVEYELNSGGYVFAENLSANDVDDSFNVPGYVDGVSTLTFRVRAENASGNSAFTVSNLLLP